MNFNRLLLSDKASFEKAYLESNMYGDFPNFETDFTTMFLYRDILNLEICICDETVFLRAKFREMDIYYPPIAKDEKTFLKAVRKLEKFKSDKFLLFGLTLKMKKLLEENRFNFVFFQNRDNYEYIYKPRRLINLDTDFLYRKQIQLKIFKKKTGEFRRYKKEDKESVLNLFKLWLDEKHELSADMKSFFACMDHYDELNILGGVIEQKGKIIGASFGIKNKKNCGIVLFEKADLRIRGSYTFLMNNFAKEYFSDCKYISRQEDMGLAGLRQSKISYQPCGFSEKYVATCGYTL